MTSRETSQKRGYGEACGHCRKSRRKCKPSEFDSATCVNCHEAAIECSLSHSRATPSTDTKRKVEEINDTPERESFRVDRASSSATASHNPRDPSMPPARKKPRPDNAQSAPHNRTPPPKNKRKISPDACGICLKVQVSSGEKKGDNIMLKCDIENCPKWYHLSCVMFAPNARQIFYSLATGTEATFLICPSCFDPERLDLVSAVEQATSVFRDTMQRIHRAIRHEKDGWPQTYNPTPLFEQDARHAREQNQEPLELEIPRATDFEPAREEKYQGFDTEKIKSLLVNIEDAVYEYDREICWANKLFSDGNDTAMETPLKAWSLVDPQHHLPDGEEWFNIKCTANNLSERHAPITATLRRMLRIPDDKPLHIGPDLKELTFSQVHMALINWFVFDVLSNKLNIYQVPNMKPLKAMMSAVANFGDARWKGNGRQVLREVQLRSWHKEQFREEVIENVGWQGELIRRLEDFLEPLTKKVGKIDPWSPSRANIIKHTIELWSYLEAAMGTLEILQPVIGGSFDVKSCENADEEVPSNGIAGMKVRWVAKRGFRFREDGGLKVMMKKALVVVK